MLFLKAFLRQFFMVEHVLIDEEHACRGTVLHRQIVLAGGKDMQSTPPKPTSAVLSIRPVLPFLLLTRLLNAYRPHMESI